MSGDARTMIVGIGSDFGDDRLGWIVAEQLSRRRPQIDVLQLRSPTDLLEHIDDVDDLHIVDACRGAGQAGTINCRTWPDADLTAVCFGGTHDFGLVAMLQLADRLQRLPLRVTIWSVEAADDEYPRAIIAPLSPVVAAAVEVLIDRIAAATSNAANEVKEQAHHA